MFIKYSIGKITSVEDKDGVKTIEAGQIEPEGKLLTCKKCGLQHLIKPNSLDIICCDVILKAN